MIPTDDQIRALIRELRRTEKAWDRAEARALEMARRARAGTTATDGHRTSHGAIGPGGSPAWLVENEDGHIEAVPVTPTEALALRKVPADPYGAAAELAFDLLGQAAASIRGFRNAADKCAAMVYEPDDENECCEPGCPAAAVKAGRCAPCYMRKYRWEQAHPGDVAPPLTPAELAKRPTVARLP